MGSEMLQCNDAFLAKTRIGRKSRQWGQDVANDPAVAHMRREQVKMREWPMLPASVDVRAHAAALTMNGRPEEVIAKRSHGAAAIVTRTFYFALAAIIFVFVAMLLM